MIGRHLGQIRGRYHFSVIFTVLGVLVMHMQIVRSGSLVSPIKLSEDGDRKAFEPVAKEEPRAQQMVSVADFKNYTERNIEPLRLHYWNDGADSQLTLRRNVEAFIRLIIRPKLLRGSASVDMTTNVLGRMIEFPVGISPFAFQRWVHPDGEAGTARAASSAGTVMILSSYSTTSIEEVADASPNAILWAQTYILKDRSVTAELVRKAEESGFGAIVVTVDSPVLGNKLNDRRNEIDIPHDLRLPNYEDSYKRALQRGYNGSIFDFADSLLDSTVTWQHFRWICSLTKLPVVAKGILTAEDAKIAVRNGAKAILVSNHGGRQLDSVSATIEALPEIVAAVGHEVEVYADGGFRLGTDVFKALALGARAVFAGRPIVWGLVYDGEEGVKQVLKIYEEEFRRTMFLAGAASLSEIDQSMVVSHKIYD